MNVLLLGPLKVRRLSQVLPLPPCLNQDAGTYSSFISPQSGQGRTDWWRKTLLSVWSDPMVTQFKINGIDINWQHISNPAEQVPTWQMQNWSGDGELCADIGYFKYDFCFVLQMSNRYIIELEICLWSRWIVLRAPCRQILFFLEVLILARIVSTFNIVTVIYSIYFYH